MGWLTGKKKPRQEPSSATKPDPGPKRPRGHRQRSISFGNAADLNTLARVPRLDLHKRRKTEGGILAKHARRRERERGEHPIPMTEQPRPTAPEMTPRDQSEGRAPLDLLENKHLLATPASNSARGRAPVPYTLTVSSPATQEVSEGSTGSPAPVTPGAKSKLLGNRVRTHYNAAPNEFASGSPTKLGSVIGGEAAQAMQILNRLRSVGVHTKIDLPAIVLIGNQSSAKTSQIEQLTSVSLPRGDGTCTRSVTEVRCIQAPNQKWVADVKIRRDYDDKTGERHAKIVESLVAQNIYDRKQLAAWVEKAQALLLNPSKNLDPDDEMPLENELQFTMNTVCVEIHGEDVGNLSVIDLPGLINAAKSKEEEHNIELVRRMVQMHVENAASIICVCISCKDDFENQQAISMAREADPKGARTIAVLTKPDTIERGCHNKYLKVLRGETTILGLKSAHGYFMTKTPDRWQREKEDPTPQRARLLEHEFFQGHDIWRSVEIETQEKLGSGFVGARLSQLLTKAINEQLPRLAAKVQAKLRDTQQKLENLPPSIGRENGQAYLLDLLNKFATNMRSRVEAREHKTLWKQSHELFQCFRTEILATCPKFDLLDEQAAHEKVWTIADILSHIQAARGRHLPGNTPDDATEGMIRGFVQSWVDPTHKCVERIKTILQKEVFEELGLMFGRFNILRTKLRQLLKESIRTVTLQLKERMDYIMQTEQRHPFTMNQERYEEHRQTCLQRLHDSMRRQSQPDAVLSEEELNQMVMLLEAQRGRKLDQKEIDVLFRSSKPVMNSRTDEAIETIARVLAYFKVASARFVDVVPMNIDAMLLIQFCHKLEKHLVKELNLLRMEQRDVEHLLSEDEDVAETRKKLQEALDRLDPLAAELAPYASDLPVDLPPSPNVRPGATIPPATPEPQHRRRRSISIEGQPG